MVTSIVPTVAIAQSWWISWPRPGALCLLIVTLLGTTCASSHAQITLRGTTVDFASVEEAREILTRPDDFVRRMSPFDRAARMKSDKPVTEEEYLSFAGRNVLPWSDSEREKVTAAFRGIQTELDALSLPFPEKVLVIKTTGSEEGGVNYTRSNAVVITEGHLAAPLEKIQKTIAHELFHIMSRANPKLRDELYAAIGFVKCNEVAFPAELQSRKITNPDAPINAHCVRLQIDGQENWAIPILFSSTENYDRKRGGELFEYLQFQFLLVERDETTSSVKPSYDGPNARLAGMLRVTGFHEQAGKNTGYIIHPEEILADNFSLLVMRAQNLPSPEVIEKMKRILKKEGKTGAGR